MKEWTREEVERLVPESNTEHWEQNMSFGYPSILWDALLQTRLDLEKANKVLKNLYDEKRPSYHDCLDDGLDQCEWCDAKDYLKALKGHDK